MNPLVTGSMRAPRGRPGPTTRGATTRTLKIVTCAALCAVLALTGVPLPSLHAQDAPAGGAPLAQIVPVPPPPSPSGAERQNVIVVTGRGSVDAVPDQATIVLGIQVIRPAAQDAQDQSSSVMDRVIRQVMALGIRRDAIATTAVSLLPVRRPAQPAEITGYQASNRIRVSVDDLRLTGKIVDTAVAAGANSLDSLTFGLKDPSSYRIRALRSAVDRAHAAAVAIASAAGVSNLRLVRIEEAGAIPVPRVGLSAPAIQGAETPVMPGTLTVTAEVRAVYGF